MAGNEFQSIKDQLVEQKITKQVTIVAGATTTTAINIPRDKKVFLKGYGYSWFSTNEFTLSTGNRQFPTGSDQQGSPSIPMIFGNPFPCRAGGKLQLTIKNGDATDHTYDIVFYILTNDHLDEVSTGSELILNTGSGTGSGGNVAIYDSTYSTTASVTADGLEVHIDKSLPAGTAYMGQVRLTDGTNQPAVVTRGDGVIALAVDTELVVDGATVNIENVFNASTDGAVSGAGYILMDANKRLSVISGESRTPTHSVATIGSASTLALALNANRKSVILINDSDETIYLNLGGTAVSNTGIRLNANGGSYEISKENGNLTTVIINGICASGSKKLLVTEFV